MPNRQVKINRAPVLTLWAVIVAKRLGHDSETALTLGKAVAGLNAQSKGKRLGIFSETEDRSEKKDRKTPQEAGSISVNVLGRAVPVVRTKEGLRAILKGDPIDPQGVKRYLEKKFGDDLNDVQAAMEALANSFAPRELETRAYSLYETFRPNIPEGEKGWGAKGELDLNKIRSLAP